MVGDRQALRSSRRASRRIAGAGAAIVVTVFATFALIWSVTQPLSGPPDPTQLARIDASSVWSVAFSPAGRILAVGGLRDDPVELWDVSDPSDPVRTGVLTGRHGPATVAFSPDGRTLAVAGQEPTTILWDVSNPARPVRVASLTGMGATVQAVAFSPDGHTVATALRDGTAALWDVTDRSRPTRAGALAGHSEQLMDVSFSPDGRTVATASADATAALWDVTDIARPHRAAVLTGHTHVVYAVAFSPDGRSLVTGSGDRSAALWDVRDPVRPSRSAVLNRTRHGHEFGQVLDVAFSPDGRTLAIAAASFVEGTPLWDVTDRARPTPTGSIGGVRNVAFSPRGRILSSGGALFHVPRDGPAWDLRNRLHPVPQMSAADVAYVAWLGGCGLALLAMSLLGRRGRRLAGYLRLANAVVGVLLLVYTLAVLVVVDIKAIGDANPTPGLIPVFLLTLIPVFLLIWSARARKRHRSIPGEGAPDAD